MLTNPAQQSANRTASRSELSSNWRTRIDAPPRIGNNAATRTPGLTSKPAQRQQSDLLIQGRGSNVDRSNEPLDEKSLRGEDHPSTLQAIAEGRRLYVGNMPYFAKTEDVEALFVDCNYQM